MARTDASPDVMIPRAIVDVALPPDEHTLNIKVYRGRASRDVAASPGELLCRIDARCVIVLAFLGAGVGPPASVPAAFAAQQGMPSEEESVGRIRE